MAKSKPAVLSPDRHPSLSDRQRAALPIVAGAPTIRAGIEAAGIPSATWYRWCEDDAFRVAFRELQQAQVEESLSDAKRGLRFAVSGLLGLVASKDERVRLGACRALADLGLKAIEVCDQEERLVAIERALGPFLETAAP